MKLPQGVEQRIVTYLRHQKKAFRTAHSKWWPSCSDPSVYGDLSVQAACGRYFFSNRDQPRYGFGEVLVGREWEKKGYVCWSSVKLFRKPARALHGYHQYQTQVVEALLRTTTGLVPQEKYVIEYHRKDLRLKNIDLVGFHFGQRRWIFTEVKVDRDRLHPEQIEALRFLRQLFSANQADVFVTSVQLQEHRPRRNPRPSTRYRG